MSAVSIKFLSASSSKACASRGHFLILLFLSPDIHELWHSLMTICLITVVNNGLY